MRLPFARKQRPVITPVGTEETGILYLLKKGAVSPLERPVPVQQQQKDEAEFQKILLRATKRIAKDQKISLQKAQKLVFVGDPDIEGDEGYINLYAHLSEEESATLLESNQRSATLPDKAATLMIQLRMAFPVMLKNTLAGGVAQGDIEPLGFDVPAGSRAMFSDVVVVIAQNMTEGCETLVVDPAHREISGAGFLLVDGGTAYKIGMPDWTAEDTMHLPEGLISELYRFYQFESTGLDPDAPVTLPEVTDGDDTDPLEKSKSTSTLTLPASTGEKFTGSSSHSDAPTPDLVTSTLETNPNG